MGEMRGNDVHSPTNQSPYWAKNKEGKHRIDAQFQQNKTGTRHAP